MSLPKREWWSAAWPGKPLPVQPRLAVLNYAMSATMRPTAPNETILHGLLSKEKFHDREPEAVLQAIEALDPSFFDSYPKKDGTELNSAFKKAAISEACRSFYQHGLAAYGKPNLRGPKPSHLLAAI